MVSASLHSRRTKMDAALVVLYARYSWLGKSLLQPSRIPWSFNTMSNEPPQEYIVSRSVTQQK
jgi:hypothetical protein